MIRLHTKELSICSEDIRSLKKYTLELSEHLHTASMLDAEGTQPYFRCIQNVAKLDRCFESMSDLLALIGEDAAVTSQKIQKVIEQHLYEATRLQG